MRAEPITRYDNDSAEYRIHRDWMPSEVGCIAIEMAERWGMVACIQDGEDSAGRQKMRLMTPEELADRAMDTAQALYNKMQERAHVIACLPRPINQAHKKITGE